MWAGGSVVLVAPSTGAPGWSGGWGVLLSVDPPPSSGPSAESSPSSVPTASASPSGSPQVQGVPVPGSSEPGAPSPWDAGHVDAVLIGLALLVFLLTAHLVGSWGRG